MFTSPLFFKSWLLGKQSRLIVQELDAEVEGIRITLGLGAWGSGFEGVTVVGFRVRVW